MSDSLQSHRMQHTGSSVLHYLLAFAQIHVHWVGEAIISSSSATPFFFCFQSFPSSGSFPMSQLLAFGSQDTGGSASASVLPMISFRIYWFDLLAAQGTVFSSTTVWKHQFFNTGIFMVQILHQHMTTGNTITFTIRIFFGKVMSLLFNMLSRFVIASLPRSKYLLILRLQSLSSTVILEPKKRKSHCFHFFPSICHEVMDWMPWN